VVVHQPGGEARVVVNGTVVLTGPSRYVARIEVEVDGR
jgi:hypothetical protein